MPKKIEPSGISKNTSEALRPPVLTDLTKSVPHEIWRSIFAFSGQDDIKNIAHSCRLFYRLTNQFTHLSKGINEYIMRTFFHPFWFEKTRPITSTKTVMHSLILLKYPNGTINKKKVQLLTNRFASLIKQTEAKIRFCKKQPLLYYDQPVSDANNTMNILFNMFLFLTQTEENINILKEIIKNKEFIHFTNVFAATLSYFLAFCNQEQFIKYDKLIDYFSYDITETIIKNTIKLASLNGTIHPYLVKVKSHFTDKEISDHIEFLKETYIIACAHGHLNIVEYLLTFNEIYKMATSANCIWSFDSQSTLESAIEKGHIHIVKYLIKLNDIQLDLAIELAALYGKLDIVKYLFDKQKKIPKKQIIHHDIDSFFYIKNFFSYLFDLKENDQYSSRNNRAFRFAIEKGHLDIVNFFVNSKPITINKTKKHSHVKEAIIHGHLDILKCLIKDFEIDPKNNELIISAAENGHLDIVKYLVNLGADPTVDNNSAFIGAVINGHLNIVHYFISLGRINYTYNENEAFIMAAKYGQLDIIKFLIRLPGVNPGAKNSLAFQLAVRNKNLDIIKYLASLDSIHPNANNNQAIITASELGNTAILEFLIGLPGVDPGARNNLAIQLATKRSHLNILQILAMHPAVDITNDDVNQAFIYAAEKGRINIIEYLITNFENIYPSAQDNQAFKLAAKNGNLRAIQLIANHPYFSITDDDVNQAFIYAAERGKMNIISFLIDNFKNTIDPSAQDNLAIQLAAKTGKLEVVKFLANHPDVDITANNNNTFVQAAGIGYIDVAKYLLNNFKNNIDPSAQDNLAFQLATKNGRLKILELLKSYPAINTAANINNAFIVAAKGKYVDVAKYLLDNFETIDPTTQDNLAIKLAIKKKNIEMVKFLIPKVNFQDLDPSSIKRIIDEIIFNKDLGGYEILLSIMSEIKNQKTVYDLIEYLIKEKKILDGDEKDLAKFHSVILSGILKKYLVIKKQKTISDEIVKYQPLLEFEKICTLIINNEFEKITNEFSQNAPINILAVFILIHLDDLNGIKKIIEKIKFTKSQMEFLVKISSFASYMNAWYMENNQNSITTYLKSQLVEKDFVISRKRKRKENKENSPIEKKIQKIDEQLPSFIQSNDPMKIDESTPKITKDDNEKNKLIKKYINLIQIKKEFSETKSLKDISEIFSIFLNYLEII